MSKLTLSEAIKHCLEVAEQLDEKAKTLTFPHLPTEMKECRECAADHRQLAEWLTELKQWRRVYGVCPSYEMCIPECREGYDAQIAEYKRLLEAAMEDMKVLYETGKDEGCVGIEFEWRYAAEALKLIGEESK